MKTKKNIFIAFFILSLFGLKSQNGLENIIVETYYISDANDTLDRKFGGFLPIGSTTYRIYLDMLPEYRFYACYGKAGHQLKIATTTTFFNNEDIGNKNPNVIPRHTLNRNSVMLDSWLSAGSAGEAYYGVLKTDDDTIGTIIHDNLFLKNKNKLAGIPLIERDGLMAAESVPFPVFFGIDQLTNVFYNQTISGSFSTVDGAWGCLGGAVGRDSLGTNRLLIAQFTTTGDLSFELNLQIGKRNYAPEYFVASQPLADEYMLPCLKYNSKKRSLVNAKKGQELSKKNEVTKHKQSTK